MQPREALAVDKLQTLGGGGGGGGGDDRARGRERAGQDFPLHQTHILSIKLI